MHTCQIFASLLLAAPAIAFAQAQTPAPACISPEARQFDFWVGDWDVYPRAAPDRLIAHSKVERMFGGCAIRETWMPLKGGGGGSLNAWRPEEGNWRQTWVDSTGLWVEFHGGRRGAAMVLQGPSGQPAQPGKAKQLTRMTFEPIADGEVNQRGETSDDDGKSWQPSFDFIYRPSAKMS